jgi:excisionase family DNA binding protein
MNQQFFMLTEESISKLAEQITANINKQLQPTTSAVSEDEFLNINELSKLIGLTKPTLYGHVHRKTIPFIKKGKMLRFSKKSILNWLEEGKSQSKSALEDKVNDYLAKKPLF